MTKLRERFGEFDDKNAIYKADEGKFYGRRFLWAYILGSALGAALLGAASLFVGEAAAAAIVLAVMVPALVWYVIWRRKRNKELTGSPTKWPDAS